MEKENPINEASLEHGLIVCLNHKKEGKTIDDLIKHIKNQLQIIKQQKFHKNESKFH